MLETKKRAPLLASNDPPPVEIINDAATDDGIEAWAMMLGDAINRFAETLD